MRTKRRPLQTGALDWGRAAIPVDELGRSTPLARVEPAASGGAVDWSRAAIPVDEAGRSIGTKQPSRPVTERPSVDWSRAAIPMGPDGRSDPRIAVQRQSVTGFEAPRADLRGGRRPRLPTMAEAAATSGEAAVRAETRGADALRPPHGDRCPCPQVSGKAVAAGPAGPSSTESGSYLDRPIPMRSGPRFTPREWFAALRAEGIEPQEGDDDEAAATHLAPLFRPDLARPSDALCLSGQAGSGPGNGAPGGSGGADAHSRKQSPIPVIPMALQSGGVVDATMGVAEGAFALSADPNERFFCGDEYIEFGLYSEMVADLAAMGAGRIRRAKRCDLYWGSLFPRQDYDVAGSYQDGVLFPKPAEIEPKLRAIGWAALVPFERMVLACRRHGIKLSVTPFHSCGGSPLTASPGEVDDGTNIRGSEASDPVYCPDGTEATWATVCAARPMHQRGVRLATTEGWDDWYWSDVDGGTDDERHYQQFAVNIWPSERGEAVDGYVSDYMIQCARRKSLGLAALADALAEYLARLRRAYLRVGHDLWDVIEEVEFANEQDGAFVREAGEVGEEDDPSALGITGAHVAGYASLELGRYCTLMSGPFRDRFPGLRFHLGECFNQPPEKLAIGAAFMYRVVDNGMRTEVRLWRERQLSRLLADRTGRDIAGEYADWNACCEDAGYWWPKRAADASELMAFGVTDLVHRAGFHWFHGVDWGYDEGALQSKPNSYYDDVALVDAISMFRDAVLTPLGARGFDVGICVNAMGFPALYPTKPSVKSADWFIRTTPIYQAAMLLRWFAVLRAAGVDYACWFTSMRSPSELTKSNYKWDAFDAMSLRNDCAFANSAGNVQRGRDHIAFPRPAWYAWQAWVTLMSYCTRLDLVHAAQGCVIIRLTLNGGIHEPLHPDRTFPYAYLMWLDQYAASSKVHDHERASTHAEVVPVGVPPAEVPFGVTLLSLIPQVIDAEQPFFGTDDGPDANGYALPARGADWDWTGWHGAVAFSTNGLLQIGTLGIADPSFAPTPICLLTDAPVLAGG